MGVHESKLFTEIDALPASKTFFVVFCAKNGVQTSESRLAQARSGKDYAGPQILALLDQINRLKKFRDAMYPLPIRFEDVNLIDTLVRDHEAGTLEFSVARVREPELIRSAFLVEFSDQTLFRGVRGGEVQRTRTPAEAAPIADEQTAIAAANVLVGMKLGQCRVIPTRLRVQLSRLVTNLKDLGFESESVD